MSEKFDYSIISFQGSLLPRERTLVAAGHVTFCDNGLLVGVGFLKTRELWSSKPNWCFRFSLPSVILADLLGNRVYVLPHPWGPWAKTTVGATWLAATRVLSQGMRQNTGNEVACSNDLCPVYNHRQELYKIQNFINLKKNRSLYWGLRYIEVRYVEVPVYIHSKFLAAFIGFTY